MKNFIQDFKERINEIDEYFDFASFIDEIETHKKQEISYNGSIKKYIPKRDLQKILRSNCYILLYNIVESCIRNAILSVYDCIHDQSLTYSELSPRLQDIWISNKTKQAQVTEKAIKSWLKGLMKEVALRSKIVLDKESIQISGNLDYENIQKIVNTYGFFGKILGDKTQIENALNKIKRERNLLAHGNKTFTQSGEIILMSELIKLKDTTSSYLEQLLKNIEDYIDQERYKN